MGEVAFVFARSAYLRTREDALVALLPLDQDAGPLHLHLSGFEQNFGRIHQGDRWRVRNDIVEGPDFAICLSAASQWHAPPIRACAQLPYPELLQPLATLSGRSDVLDTLIGNADSPLWPARLSAAMSALGHWIHGSPTGSAGGETPATQPAPACAVAALIGAGRGLTPAGDDLLAGVALALRALAPERLGALSGAVGSRLQFTHPISAALLREALEGRASATAHHVLDSLIDNDLTGHSITRLHRAGASSGFDMLAGMLLVTHKATPAC
ncbi:MAG: DUF2877 domain-containing protein [Pseudomonadota bacterium]